MEQQAASPLQFFWELIKVFVMAMVIIIPVRYFLVQPFFVRGASMEPNFEDGEYLVIDQLSYQWGIPQRGQVIVFRYPNNPSQYFIKRVIGLPGERVQITNGQVVVYNSSHPQGAVLDENSYLSSSVRTGGQTDIQLTDQEYFVLGDNRAASSDSRSWGTLPKHNIIGRTWIRAWPLPRLKVFSTTRLGFVSS